MKYFPLLLLFLLAASLLHAEVEAPEFAPLPFDLKPEETLSASQNWMSLNEAAGIQAMKQEGKMVLMMANNARFRSSDVAAYPEVMTLKASWQITNGKGAMGFGWIDFSTSQYYYLYEDLATNELILQRGDGVSTKQLAKYPLSTATEPRQFTITRKAQTAAEIVITILVNGAAVGDPVTDRPEQEMGSTFQIYVGSGNDAEVTLHSISTIKATSRKGSGSGWFW
ncbi:MAG: hypothetical protein AAF571_10060 [Verrucomicrobiota bacterium]